MDRVILFNLELMKLSLNLVGNEQKQPSEVASIEQSFSLSFLPTFKKYQHISKHIDYEEGINLDMTELLKRTISLGKLHFMHLSCGYS
ncbi:MAG: hypothetical protein ACJASL_002359 [Paraglaciecola sp.]|jgi:hypothetical protein